MKSESSQEGVLLQGLADALGSSVECTDFGYAVRSWLRQRLAPLTQNFSNMYEPSDADVRLLLADLKIDAKQAGARNHHERLKLLQKALQKTQRLSKVLKKAADSSSDPDAPFLLDPSTLKKLNSRSKLVAEKFDVDEMYSMQVGLGSPAMATCR